MIGISPRRLLAAAVVIAATMVGGAPQAGEAVRKSGYVIGPETCGDGALAFPKLRIGLAQGFCAGLVASEDDGLRFPRSIVQVPDSALFVIADMGGWGSGQGRLLRLDPAAPAGARIRELLTGLDYPFGLAIGPDRKVYASTAETIFRFDPRADNPAATVETIVHGLPGRRIRLSDGTRVEDSSHPLKAFMFDRTGRLFVNVGSHSDDCITPGPIRKPCPAGEGASPLAAIWMFVPPAGGVFATLKPNDPNPHREIYAQGLRNSMALALHPDFPDAGFAFLQGENGRDLPDIFKPNEEINAIEPGKHYGWPYCYDNTTESPEFKAVLAAAGPYRHLCANTARYRQPATLMPPHGAPLAMLYYQGSKFPQLAGRLIVGLHGYRPTGSRVLVYEVDARGFPVKSSPPVRYHVSCGTEPTHTFQADGVDVAAAPFTELVSEWHKVNGVRPQGAPVGLTVAADGAIWLVEDKNRTVIRIDATTAAPDAAEPCDRRSDAQIDALARFVAASAPNRARLSAFRAGVVEKHCVGCHADFGLKAGLSDAQKDDTVLRFMLGQDGWIFPGDPDAGKLRTRLRGVGAERLMPPGGEGLAAHEAGYAQLLDRVDLLVGTMVPGTRMRIRGGVVQRRFFARDGRECGNIPAGKVVVVTESPATGKTGFSRIYRPADLYLNGDCSDDQGYYIPQGSLAPL
ncbi:PQQ-dependent sugar dehydrogenase [Bradyrhizobium sp. U87765 SZCCT0131]|uniref:PQQ-dependent sugar dehydrogenase n=2 Tax=Bradyrhizobium TaxID=374 RepID=UPI001BA5C559|nr:PQQ-dependent sugar dehydrogenase [Bradyrhizobium sp. U87765 SZCCT0131]MBR1261101.1 PQQ-dependent sugar dehydrogenase [Bradyrhizobium sp. U87765 SZCCT0134]MBR1303451.1 PQQ-dependent sugar dehydrogenase [Bradyrhizobium sp. U87765 SZCCT0110]MBR1319057.1 PQQ-dependent sugar dehydrogenase [Bradyrhizobium sp. U87765 SZCCT0109]MBR1347382.1 PQQ-dependent sugar dehydrogenase [Bradyrhizobium sp. U87765 SZCCT0048]